jgi:hypothetical protein
MTWEFPAHWYLEWAKADLIALGTPGRHWARPAEFGEPSGDVMIIGVLLAARPRRNTRDGDGRLRFPPSDSPQSPPTRHIRSRSTSAPRPRHDRRPFFPFRPVDGATWYTGAEIDTMKPTGIAGLRAQTVTG